MAWFSGKVSLGNFPDLAGAVNKFSESVKNIEKNFDTALGLDDKAAASSGGGGGTSTTEASGAWPADLMAFMGQKGENVTVDSTEKLESSSPQASSLSREKEGDQADKSADSVDEHSQSVTEEHVETVKPEEHEDYPAETNTEILEEANNATQKPEETNVIKDEQADIADKPLETNDILTKDAIDVVDKSVETNISVSDEATKSEVKADEEAESSADHAEQSESVEHVPSRDNSEIIPIQEESANTVNQVVGTSELNEVHHARDLQKDEDELKTQSEETSLEVSVAEVPEPTYDSQAGNTTELDDIQSVTLEAAKTAEEGQPHSVESSGDVSAMVPGVVSQEENPTAEVYISGQLASDNQSDIKEQRLSSESNSSENAASMLELEKVTREMKMMETALLGAARQAQRKPNEADIESLREEYHQRVSTLERKVYALTKERDTLRREQNKKSDAAALLKEKDEIITQIMAEGEGLSKKQATQESLIRKLRAQIREFEEEKKGLMAKLQETTARRAETWTAVERSLTSRLQEAEAKCAAAEERERSVNERLSQTLSRINVLEAQISCLRAEQTQLTRSLEKERQKASENRQEYLALKEEVDTHKDHVNQREEEIRELKRKHKQELQEALAHQELLQQDIERERATRLELETTARQQSSIASEPSPLARTKSLYDNGLTHRLSNASSIGSMEESFFLQASLGSSDTLSERRNHGEPTMSSYYLKSMTPNAFEAALRQKEGELASYMSRLASMESIRDSLAEELVKMTEECEKLRSEVSLMPVLKADIEALRSRHSAALELMGERDEELEELRADIVDLKEMYREQVNMLVNKIQFIAFVHQVQ
ncbi:golgin candidate 5 [Artemisia annua]|uniref:Golgin candidate 5 n=1 Tax=Artemisia annua TaxID=35608 RepID=A0A2U1PM10_ARTAN|nr:golgin candidate 5 [Artemisia annua]